MSDVIKRSENCLMVYVPEELDHHFAQQITKVVDEELEKGEISQLVFDFSDKEYNFVKTHMGNGKMIEAIINEFKEENYPLPAEIVKCVENYMSSIT